MPLKSVGEFDLIERLKRFQNLSPRVVCGIGDDAAVAALDARRYQLLTTDMLIEDVHFTRQMDWQKVGHKAMACNISDIAAMGGIPTVALVSIGIPRGLKAREVERIYRGMHGCAKRFNVSIVGGDTVRAEKLVVNVALIGEVEKSCLVLRSGARPGDKIFVTGRLGGSLQSGRHLTFTPRLKEARTLATRFRPSAMMDISDGIAGDLRHLLKASHAGARIDALAIPCHAGAALEAALTDGEDFELLFTLPSRKAGRMLKYMRTKHQVRCTEIGEITRVPGELLMIDAEGKSRPLTLKGYRHF